MKGVTNMLRVLTSRSFNGKKDPSRQFHVVDLIGDDGQIATDVFVDQPIPAGSYVIVKERIINHKLSCTVEAVAEKK